VLCELDRDVGRGAGRGFVRCVLLGVGVGAGGGVEVGRAEVDSTGDGLTAADVVAARPFELDVQPARTASVHTTIALRPDRRASTRG
jgi:hypothetical protein